MKKRGLSSYRRKISDVVSVLLIFFCSVTSVYASGFAIYTQSASSLGEGSAVVAHSNDPSAIFFNPALINDLEGTQISLGTTLLFPSRTFKSDATGRKFDAKSDVLFPSTFFITHKFDERVSAGLGIFNPFGLRNEWGDDWEGRYLTTNAEMQTFNINPAVSCRLSDAVSFAAGLDFLILDTTLEKKINLSAFGLPDAGQKFDGDGTGVGYNLGVAVDISEDVAFGASYRSEIRVTIDGDADHSLHQVVPLQLRALFPNTSGSAELTLPQQFFAGIYYKGFAPFTFEAGMRWEGWSSFKELRIDLDQPVAGMMTSVVDKDWKDTYTANFGARYSLNENIALLAGYLYSGNPIPDRTFEPSIPDADTHLFTVGTDIRYGGFTFDLAFAYQKLQDRHKNNAVDDMPEDGLLNPATAANGSYETDIHMVAFSLTYRF